MTRQELEAMELQAQHADDPRAYRNEMAEVRRLKAKYGHARTFPQTPQPQAVRRPTGRRVATSVSHAVQMMEGSHG